MKTIKKRMAMSIGFLMMAGVLGCAYEPDNSGTKGQTVCPRRFVPAWDGVCDRYVKE